MKSHCANILFIKLRYITLLFILLIPIKLISQENLQLNFSGEIKTLCEFTTQQQITATNLNNKYFTLIPFQFYCNQAMTLTIKSEYGGVKHQSIGIVIPYLLKVEIPKIDISETLQSKDLIEMASFSSSTIPYSAEGKLDVLLSKDLPYSGLYHDTITMNIAPSLVVSP